MQKDANGFGTAENPVLLLIEPRWPQGSGGAVQFEAARFTVITAHNARDIYLLSGSIQPPYAVISDKVGSAALRASAEAVRWQWPWTLIVILGIPGELDDHLYDDSMAHTSDASELLTAVEKIIENPSKQRVNNRR